MLAIMPTVMNAVKWWVKTNAQDAVENKRVVCQSCFSMNIKINVM